MIRGMMAIQTPPNKPIKTYSADDILSSSFPSTNFLIPGMLPVGLAILAGDPKIGKSWLGLQLGKIVSLGDQIFGQDVVQGGVLYLSLEDPPARLQTRLLKQGWPQGCPVNFLPLGDFATQINYLNLGGAKKLADQIQLQNYRLVVIDTVSRAFLGDKNEEEIMTKALTPMQEMAHKYFCTVLMIDHLKKGKGLDQDPIADILGSVAKGAMADTIWGLYRKRGQVGAKLVITGRDVQDITLDVSLDNANGMWILKGAGTPVITPRMQEILDALKILGLAQLDQIATQINQDRGNTQRRLQNLVQDGLIQRKEAFPNVFYCL